jgi:hypothetical protein
LEKVHNNELNDLYFSTNIDRVNKLRRIRCVIHVARIGERRGVYRLVVGKSEIKKPLGRPSRAWEDNIRKDLQDVGGGAWTGWVCLRTGTGGGHW